MLPAHIFIDQLIHQSQDAQTDLKSDKFIMNRGGMHLDLEVLVYFQGRDEAEERACDVAHNACNQNCRSEFRRGHD
jgi:hypothetical protein